MAKDIKEQAKVPGQAPQGAAPKKKEFHGAPKQDVGQHDGCKFEACKSKPSKFGFCKDHYEMYMAGVVRGDGQKPIDFEDKLRHWTQQQKGGRKVA